MGIQSLIQTQKYLILKILQTKHPSIETLKVGYFVENELKSKSNPNVIKNKKTHIPTPSTPMLGQSFTPIIGLNQLEQSDSSDDDGLITSPHGRSSSLRINILIRSIHQIIKVKVIWIQMMFCALLTVQMMS